MINNSKITEKTATLQVAGLLPGDSTIEFIGISETQEVLWLQNGRTLPFKYLPKTIYQKCQEKYLSDAIAFKELSQLPISTERQVEVFIYHLYGDIDSKPDFKDENLQPSENYRHQKNTSCLSWDTKWLTIDGIVLTNRDLRIIDLMIEDAPDKLIAVELGISHSTLDFHKRNLYKKFSVKTKIELIIKVKNQHVA